MKKLYNKLYFKDAPWFCRAAFIIICVLYIIFDLFSIVFEYAGGSGIEKNNHVFALVFLIFSILIVWKRGKTNKNTNSRFLVFIELAIAIFSFSFTLMLLNEMMTVSFSLPVFLLQLAICYIIFGIIFENIIEVLNNNSLKIN